MDKHDKILKQQLAEFKGWYIKRICSHGVYRMRIVELDGVGVQYVVERDGSLYQIWKDGEHGEYIKVV